MLLQEVANKVMPRRKDFLLSMWNKDWNNIRERELLLNVNNNNNNINNNNECEIRIGII
jgi:hypothetical protein